MTRALAMATLAALLALALLGRAQALPYETVASAEPDAAWLSAGSPLEHALLPDARGGVLLRSDYSEYATARRRVGILTLAAGQSGYLSLLHYNAERCHLLRRAVPLPAGQLTTLTFELPEDGGLSRLLLWDRPPDGWELFAARYPNAASDPLPGALAQRWLPRVEPSTLPSLPWDDPFAPARLFPEPRRILRRPLIGAWIGADMAVRAKDCAAGFTGLPRLMPNGGAAWPVAWGSELSFDFELPAQLPTGSAVLGLGLAGGLPAPDLEVWVNGWRAEPEAALPGLPTGSAGAPARRYSVTTLLRSGGNRVELRLGGLTAGEALLSRMDLWVE